MEALKHLMCRLLSLDKMLYSTVLKQFMQRQCEEEVSIKFQEAIADLFSWQLISMQMQMRALVTIFY